MRNDIRKMHNRHPIDVLLPKTRQGILAATLCSPERWWYLTDLAKQIGVPASSLQRDLAALVEARIFERRRDGNRVYFRPFAECPFLPELRGLILKTVGLVDVLREGLAEIENRIQSAFVCGPIAAGDGHVGGPVELMVIGEAGFSEYSRALAGVQERLGREVKLTAYSAAEFTNNLRGGYPFPREIMNGPKLFVVGSERSLQAAIAIGRRNAVAERRGL